mgnify:CR=1 FL=1
MSDYYKSKGDLKNAREILEKGLSSSPDVNALKRRLAELDSAKGKPNAARESPRKPATPEKSTQDTATQAAQKTEAPQAPAQR